MTIKFNKPFVSGREREYIDQVFANDFFGGNGPFTKKAQAFLEQRYGVPHVLLTHSCTGALELAALLLDLGPDDEVIVPSYTFSSTAAAFLRTGAKIVFCEVDVSNMTVDVDDIAARVTAKTRAVVPIVYGGISADLDRLRDALAGKRITIVEDAAQGLEAKYRGRACGTSTPLAALSFHETKNIHCGLGGALFINDVTLFERAEDIWERGTDRSKLFKGLVDKYSWVELGSSFYPSELQAAFLLAQLEAVERNLAERAQLYDAYATSFAALEQASRLAIPRAAWPVTSNAHAFFVMCRTGAECDGLRVHLAQAQIQAFIGYVPLHSSKMGARLGYRAEDLPKTEERAARVLRLPLHNSMTVSDVHRVASIAAEFFSR